MIPWPTSAQEDPDLVAKGSPDQAGQVDPGDSGGRGARDPRGLEAGAGQDPADPAAGGRDPPDPRA